MIATTCIVVLVVGLAFAYWFLPPLISSSLKPALGFLITDSTKSPRARMDQFKQAVNLARGGAPAVQSVEQVPLVGPGSAMAAVSSTFESKIKNVPLKASHLESMRVVAHNKDDPRGRAFDMLRAQVLQSMDNGGWQVLAVTSPTAGNGKTVTACNLALSIARLPERSVLLVDMDMRKPKVANYLGIKVILDC